MIEVTATVRKWGRSKGVVIPNAATEKEKLKIGDEVSLLIRKKSKKNPLRETWGIMKFSRPVKEILKEVDREGWDG
ncbi:MAG: hypothetical protein HY544_00025 [Candidatus Diapherotrites archaeon]|uniref:SpoVT-AbrB domain-containing protein n=1 Tax=Candidatus Iainarchaeum sp. TaxID=3101447 RepID=A0A8T3YHZ2_9ARCH|nr:hypothetical protein [Candidatus Diapherotrites archaeon]